MDKKLKMEKTIKKLLWLTGVVVAISSCSNDTSVNSNNAVHDATKEYEYLRMIVSDEKTNDITHINLHDDKTISFTGKFPQSAVYTSGSGRFATIVHRTNNLVETFDVGLEWHGNHVDNKGDPKFGLMVGNSAMPTHFKGRNGEFLLFNDGDATLSRGYETDVNKQSTMETINAGLIAHHGAMAHFSNETYAVTLKDNTVAGVLPERVIVIDKSGKKIHESTIATAGIHGNATNGTNAVFGSASGILVVNSNGTQRLIPHPAGFEKAWFGTILETSMDNKFIGYTAAKGAYLIDIATDSVTPLIESTDIMQCKTSYDLSKLGVLLHSGELKIIDLATKATLLNGPIIAATEKTSKQKPQMVLSSKFIYTTSPLTGEIQKTQIAPPYTVTKIKVSATPYRLTILGYESNDSH
jgi:hypothetical protein